MPTADLHLASRKGQESRVQSPPRVRMISCQVHVMLGHMVMAGGETGSPVEIHPPWSWLPCSASRCRGKYTKPPQTLKDTNHDMSSTCSNCPIQCKLHLSPQSATEIEETPLLAPVVVVSAAMETGIGKRTTFYLLLLHTVAHLSAAKMIYETASTTFLTWSCSCLTRT
jgi:hypothetical protein